MYFIALDQSISLNPGSWKEWSYFDPSYLALSAAVLGFGVRPPATHILVQVEETGALTIFAVISFVVIPHTVLLETQSCADHALSWNREKERSSRNRIAMLDYLGRFPFTKRKFQQEVPACKGFFHRQAQILIFKTLQSRVCD